MAKKRVFIRVPVDVEDEDVEAGAEVAKTIAKGENATMGDVLSMIGTVKEAVVRNVKKIRGGR